MIPDEIHRLLTRAAELGNHYQKNIRYIETIFPSLYKKLSQQNVLEKVCVHALSDNFGADMEQIYRLCSDRKTVLNYLGCYYSVQLLYMNIYFLDWLDFQLHGQKIRWQVYKKFILKSGAKFRDLTAAYMQCLLDLLREERPLPGFVLAGVGTRSDQDDIDVGIIDDGSEDRLWLNQIIDRMGVEMMRFASNFHFHLSEHVGNQVYSASITEYQRLLRTNIGNCVILTEMLGAAYIIGDEQLFQSFLSKVTDRYYYQGRPNRYHEGYLRGILGEIKDLSCRPLDKDSFHPKFDGLRMIKNTIYAYKTRFGIQQVNPWQILQELKRLYPDFKSQFHILERSLSFLEIFRYLYQQLVVQEEYINLNDRDILQNLQNVATRLHYRDFGPHQAVYHLLHDYKIAVVEMRTILSDLIDDLSGHLKEVSTFRRIFEKPDTHKNVRSLFQKNLRFFHSSHFWNDLFKMIDEDQISARDIMLGELLMLEMEERRAFFKSLADWAGSYPEFIFRFCVFLSRSDALRSLEMVNECIDLYVTKFAGEFDFNQHLISLYRKEPSLFCQVLQICDIKNVQKMKNILYKRTFRGQFAPFQKNLAELLNLMQNCSHYFKRVIHNLHDQFPEYACFIREPGLIDRQCENIIRHLPFHRSVSRKKQVIGNYYDLKFLQIGLETLQNLPVLTLNRNFTSFVNIYLQELFKICLKQVVNNARIENRLRNKILLYACGGNGREQAFDDDFDLIILINDRYETRDELYREIVACLNTEMIKRGTLPHFRFIDHFGEYFCRMEDLEELLRSGYNDIYVDKSQLLECRLLVGSAISHNEFLTRIVKGLIFSQKEEYLAQMTQEIRQRHGSITFFREKCANIKECTGGLRDIEMIILMYKVLYEMNETNPYQLILKFGERDRKLKRYWESIRKSLIFLQRFRYFYRLIITAEDQIYNEGLDSVALKFNPELPQMVDPTAWIWEQFVEHRKEAWNSLRCLVNEIGIEQTVPS